MIRKACSADASRLAEILIFTKRSTYREIFHNDLVSFGEMQVLPLALEYQNDPQMLETIVVYDDGIVKGMANILHTMEDAQTITELKELYTDTFFQGEGIGAALMRETRRQAERNASSCILLWVLEKNQQARRFYQRQGYIATGERQLMEGTEEYVIQYSLSLSPIEG